MLMVYDEIIFWRFFAHFYYLAVFQFVCCRLLPYDLFCEIRCYILLLFVYESNQIISRVE